MALRPLVVLALGLLLLGGACSTSDEAETLSGVVIGVEGTIQSIESFTVRLTDGTDATFRPVAGLLFDHTAPLSHIRDHLATGDPVKVEYETLPDGILSAVAVGDG